MWEEEAAKKKRKVLNRAKLTYTLVILTQAMLQRKPSKPVLGGGISPNLIQGEKTGKIERYHLVANRILGWEAAEKGIQLIDMGTDYSYPFYNDYEPTQKALQALGDYAKEALHYPSSYGLISLRSSFQNFMEIQFNIKLDLHQEIMITTGASQVFDAISRSFAGTYVLVPEFTLSTVAIIASGNGAEIVRLPIGDCGFVELAKAEEIINSLPSKSIRFLYLNSPCNPTGKVASREYLHELVQLALKHSILILHDMDSWYTTHNCDTDLVNILEIPKAKDCSLTVLSLSKEFGLPGLRIGLVAGNDDVIDTIRMHNSTFSVMIPEMCQYAAKAALDDFHANRQKPDINEYVSYLTQKSIKGWRDLGWTPEAINSPDGGFKYLISVPPHLREQDGFTAVELFDYYVLSRAYVKLSTIRSFNPDHDGYIRLIMMQNEELLDEAFRRMKEIGVDYHSMKLPDSLGKEYAELIQKHMGGDF
jgi:aspartate/methionine/tyrosine aminotransferase